MIALGVLNKLGITAWNHLEVTRFALNDYAKTFLTPAYAYTLAINFGPHADYAQDIKNAKGPMQIVVGNDDELFEAGRFKGVFAEAGKTVTVTTLPGIDHMGLTLQQPAVEAIARLCQF